MDTIATDSGKTDLPNNPVDLFRVAYHAHEKGDTKRVEEVKEALRKFGVSLKFVRLDPSRPRPVCLMCGEKAKLRGLCEEHHRAVKRFIRKGEYTEEQAIEMGLILASQKPWSHRPTGAAADVRERVKAWIKKGV